jgi:hypothetical protein
MARRKMNKFRIDEISAVDRPAQQGATVSILKRDDNKDPKGLLNKKAAMTTSADGHAHLVVSEDFDGERNQGFTTLEADSSGRMHSHPWVRQEDGTIVIGDVFDHTHGVQTMSKAGEANDKQENDPMTKKEETVVTPEQLAELQKNLDEANAKLAKAEAIAKLNAAERDHYMLITDADEAAAFLAKSADERKSVVAKAAEADAVVYTDSQGQEYRKSDDPRLVALAKQADADRKEAATAREEVRKADLRKRADETLGNLTGDDSVHVDILDAIEKGITDDDRRAKALEVLKAANTASAGVFKSKGVEDNTTGSAADQLDAMAKAHAKEHDVTYAKAYSAVMSTPEGKQLYAQTLS